MNQISITSSTTSERIETISSESNAIAVLHPQTEEINRNKPWRVVIRRIVADGGSNYENVSGKFESD